jgi:phosphotriesterase-related protein
VLKKSIGISMVKLITTLGPKRRDELGMILPHEHVFVDLRTPDQQGYPEARAEKVIELMAPEIKRVWNLGVTAIVESSPVGVGRRADILKAVSEATQFPLVVPTGIYREPWVPEWAYQASEEELYEWMRMELQDQIEESRVQAGWIKLSAGDNGLTEVETKILRAAARAGARTGAVIGSHTISGRVLREQLDVIEEEGYSASRFIWVHAQNEPDIELNIEIARRGAWIEYDAIGGLLPDDFYIKRIQQMIGAELDNRLLLSHDRGWYDPAKPGGGIPRPFTHINLNFLPKLRAAGIDEGTILNVTCSNPFHAFARP